MSWLPRESDLSKIMAYFGKRLPSDSRVKIWPRSLIDEVMKRRTEPYSFRAVTRGNVSDVFVDETETPESIAFLIAHELTHQLVNNSPTVKSAFEEAKDPSMDKKSDEFHNCDAEERFCDGIAKGILGTWYDRAWWRNNTESIDALSSTE